ATPAPEWKPVASAALGMLLYGGAYLALGTFLSTVTKNQMVSAALSFTLFLGMLILGWMVNDPTGGVVSKVLSELSFTKHMDDMIKGVIDLKVVVFFLSVIVFGLFISHQSVASERWRS